MQLDGWEAFRKSLFHYFKSIVVNVALFGRQNSWPALVPRTVCWSVPPRGQGQCWQTWCMFFFIFMWLWFTNILFFAYAKRSLQSNSGPTTPPDAGSGKAPESTDGWLGNSSSAISQRRMPDHSAGEQRLLRGWDTAFCATHSARPKVIISMPVFAPTLGTAVTSY